MASSLPYEHDQIRKEAAVNQLQRRSSPPPYRSNGDCLYEIITHTNSSLFFFLQLDYFLRRKRRVPNLFSPARDFLSIQRIHAERQVKGETLLSRSFFFFFLSQNLVWMSKKKKKTSVLRLNLCNLTPDMKPLVQFLCSLSSLESSSSPWQEMNQHTKHFNVHFKRRCRLLNR